MDTVFHSYRTEGFSFDPTPFEPERSKWFPLRELAVFVTAAALAGFLALSFGGDATSDSGEEMHGRCSRTTESFAGGEKCRS